MIDLRSDTLTKPTTDMRHAMFRAQVGDEGRTDLRGRGEDQTVNKLENLAAKITGKEEAIFLFSGTMANLVALLTYCKRGQSVCIDKNFHIYKNEKVGFLNEFGGLIPIFYNLSKYDIKKNFNNLQNFLKKKEIHLLCLENSFNFGGGTCLNKDQIDSICFLSQKYKIPVHLDGARIFNASQYLDIPVKELVKSADSLMFCLSKGLSAPIGSLLCGKHDYIFKARKIKKLLGGTTRQAGIMAAAGIVALRKEIPRLVEDYENARLLAKNISHNKLIKLDLETIQTNIIMIDVSPSGHSAKTFQKDLKKRGLFVHLASEKHIRLVTYRGINKKDITIASSIFNEYCNFLKNIKK